MKFKLNGELKIWVDGLELEGDDIDDAIHTFLSCPGKVVDTMANSSEMSIEGLDMSSDTTVELYEKEVDVVVSDIEWLRLDELSADEQAIVAILPGSFELKGVTIDNWQKDHWGNYHYEPIDDEAMNSCIVDALIEYIWHKFGIYLATDNIGDYDMEITNEE